MLFNTLFIVYCVIFLSGEKIEHSSKMTKTTSHSPWDCGCLLIYWSLISPNYISNQIIFAWI